MQHCPNASTHLLPKALSLALAAALLHSPLPLLAQTPEASATAEQPVPSRRAAKPALKASTPVTLNFVNADIEAVTRAFGVMMDRQFVVDPRVKGNITVYSEQPLSVREAYLSYLAALRGLGFTVVENTGLLKVVPEADAKLQAGSVVVGTNGQRGDQIVTQIFKLNFENANNLVAVLRPLISPNNTINANPGNNSLVITDYAENLQRMGRIIAAMDTSGATDIEVVPLKHAVASDLAALVQRLAEGGGGAAVPGAASASGLTVLADPRSNALILRAPNPARLASTRAIIEKLDRPLGDDGPGGNIRVVYLKNADAVKLATVLRSAYNPGTGGASGSGASQGQGLTPGVLTGAANSSLSGTAGSTAATTPVQASQGPSTGGFVQADPSTNSLIITAPEPMYRQLRAVIDQLDTRRAQVYVETMIVKVDAEKAAEFGFQWQGVTGSAGDHTVGVGGTNFGTGGNNLVNLTAAAALGVSPTTASSSLPGQGLNVGLLTKINGKYTLGALARFLQTNAGANILSTPNLVALDNEEAKIVIGSNVPFVTGSFTNTGGNNGSVNPFQTVERKDVGITLKIKSQIGESGTVRMTVYQESSSLRNDASAITDKSSIETTVVVDDGQTMVLGGLLKDEYGDSEGKVPGLGDLPVVGGLFRNEGRKRIKSNLMLFLRPVVIRSQESADQLTLSRYDAIRAAQQQAQPADRLLLPVSGAPLIPERKPQQPTPVFPTTTEPARAN